MSSGFTDAASWLEVGKMVMSQRVFLSMTKDILGHLLSCSVRVHDWQSVVPREFKR